MNKNELDWNKARRPSPEIFLNNIGSSLGTNRKSSLVGTCCHLGDGVETLDDWDNTTLLDGGWFLETIGVDATEEVLPERERGSALERGGSRRYVWGFVRPAARRHRKRLEK